MGPTGPLAVALGGGPRPATSAAGAGATPATKTHGGARGRGAGFSHRGSAGSWLGAFDAARRRASNGGGRRGWNGRGRPLRARRRRGATGARRKHSYGELSRERRGWGASTYGGECNGLEPVTKRSPEPCRRRAPRRGVRARVGKQLGGARERKDRGEGGEAHCEAVGRRQCARGGSSEAKRGGVRRRPCGEDELGVLVVGAPVSNGMHQTMQRATAVLGDTLGRRGGYGGRVNDGERRRARRAWGRGERRGSGGEAQRPRE